MIVDLATDIERQSHKENAPRKAAAQIHKADMMVVLLNFRTL